MSLANLGDTTSEASDNLIGHTVIHSTGPFVAPDDGDIVSISALIRLVGSVSEFYRLAVYRDTGGGAPGALVCGTAEQAFNGPVDPAAWQTVPISGEAPIVKGVSYWIAILCGRSTDGDNIHINYNSAPSGGIGLAYNNTANVAPSNLSPPDPFPTQSTIGWEYSMYATYEGFSDRPRPTGRLRFVHLRKREGRVTL